MSADVRTSRPAVCGPVPSVGGARPDGTGAPAAAGGAGPNHVFVEAIHQIARLVESGLPAPDHISILHGETVLVPSNAEDLHRWVIELDIPAPDWDYTEGPDGEHLYRTAHWPDAVTYTLLFRIAYTDRVPVPAGFGAVPAGCSLPCVLGMTGCTEDCR